MTIIFVIVGFCVIWYACQWLSGWFDYLEKSENDDWRL